jgi:hypothetical protein
MEERDVVIFSVYLCTVRCLTARATRYTHRTTAKSNTLHLPHLRRLASLSNNMLAAASMSPSASMIASITFILSAVQPVVALSRSAPTSSSFTTSAASGLSAAIARNSESRAAQMPQPPPHTHTAAPQPRTHAVSRAQPTLPTTRQSNLSDHDDDERHRRALGPASTPGRRSAAQRNARSAPARAACASAASTAAPEPPLPPRPPPPLRAAAAAACAPAACMPARTAAGSSAALVGGWSDAIMTARLSSSSCPLLKRTLTSCCERARAEQIQKFKQADFFSQAQPRHTCTAWHMAYDIWHGTAGGAGRRIIITHVLINLDHASDLVAVALNPASPP